MNGTPKNTQLPPLPPGNWRMEDENIFVPETTQPTGVEGSSLGRHAARTAARIGETLAGLASQAGQYLPSPLMALSALERPARTALELGASLGAGQPIEQAVQQAAIPLTEQPRGIQKSIPQRIGETVTQTAYSKLQEQLPKGYLEPQNQLEQLGDDIVSAFTTLAIPGIGPSGVVKKAALAVVPEVSKFLAKNLGAPTWAQEGVKIGTALATSLLPQRAAQQAQALYNQATTIPEGASVSGRNLLKAVRDQRKDLTKRAFKGKNEVLDLLDMVERTIKPEAKTIGIQDAITLKKDINSWFSHLPDMAKPELHKLVTSLKNTISLGEELFPKEIQAVMEADQLWKGIHSTQESAGFLKSIDWKKAGLPFIGSLIGYKAAPGLLTGIPLAFTTVIGLPALATKYGVNFAQKMINHPIFIKAYGRMLKAGLDENKGLALKYGKQLDTLLKKESAQLPQQAPQQQQPSALPALPPGNWEIA